MFKKIMNYKKNILFYGALILFISFGIYNILNYAFQISMAKMLGPINYGIFAVLMSFIYIFGIPIEAIQTVITKYTTKFELVKKEGKIKDLFYRSLKKGFVISISLYLILLVLAFPISKFLKIDYYLLSLCFLFIFIVFISSISRGILQGKKKFSALGVNMVAESSVKLILSIILVVLGFSVFGAIASVLIGAIAAFIFALLAIKEVLGAKRERAEMDSVYKTNLFILIAMISVVLMFNIDIFIARAVFDQNTAGQYAFVALIAKVIIFFGAAIGKTLFPISTESHESGKKTSHLLRKSAIALSILSLFFILACFTFPQLIIKIISLGSEEYFSLYSILPIMAIGSTALAFSNIIILYNLSIGKLKISSYFLLLFVLLQAILLIFYSGNITLFSISYTIANLLMLAYCIFINQNEASINNSGA